jgi:hypothetical protein
MSMRPQGEIEEDDVEGKAREHVGRGATGPSGTGHAVAPGAIAESFRRR